MKYTKSGAQTGVGPADWFTGTVYIDGIRNPDEQSSVGCSHVRFTPGARTAWHHHPKGQTPLRHRRHRPSREPRTPAPGTGVGSCSRVAGTAGENGRQRPRLPIPLCPVLVEFRHS